MRIRLDTSAARETRWSQLAVRFVLGGLITAATGIIGKKYGSGIGGLFLAFPAIFPSSATLIQKHEREKKARAGLCGSTRARRLVAVDATGAAIGSVGLFGFALLMRAEITEHNACLVILASTLLWTLLSLLLWHIRKRL